MKHLNFLPPKKNKIRLGELNILVILVAFVVLAAFSTTFSVIQKRKYKAIVKKSLEISSEIAPLRSLQASPPVEKKIVSDEVAESISNPIRWSKILGDLANRIPKSVELKKISSGEMEDRVLIVDASTYRAEALTQAKAQFAQSNWCKQVELDSLSSGKDENDVSSFSFKLKCFLP